MTMSIQFLRFSTVALALTAPAFACRPSPREAPEPLDVESIRETVLNLEEAVNLKIDESLDCVGADSHFGDQQPTFVGAGNVVRTRTELLEMCSGMIAPRSGASFSIEHITANVLSNVAAYVVREGDYTVHLKDGTSNTMYLVMTTIWHRGEDGWKIAHLHESWRTQP